MSVIYLHLLDVIYPGELLEGPCPELDSFAKIEFIIGNLIFQAICSLEPEVSSPNAFQS